MNPASAVPLVPDGEDAREWAIRELSDPVYAAAQPTPLDRIAHAVREWFESLLGGDLPGPLGPIVAVVGGGIVLAVLVASIALWGRPRRPGRGRAADGDPFGDDVRSADELRTDAATCADEGAWSEAVVLRFRALARGLAERGVLDLPAGTTVRSFARTAGEIFPDTTGLLAGAASAFDDVRYLGRPGTAERYDAVRRTDEALDRARPRVPEDVP